MPATLLPAETIETLPSNPPATDTALWPAEGRLRDVAAQKPTPAAGDTPAKDGVTEEFWVATNSDAKTMRDELLTRHFNFSPEDIAAYEQQTGGPFMIRDSGRCEAAQKNGRPCEWATARDIAKWPAQNGKVPISLKAETVKALRDFRQGRAIDAAAQGIADPVLREGVRKDVRLAAFGDGTERIAAANRLLDLEITDANDLAATRGAILETAQQPENRDNAVTNLLAGAVRLTAVADRADEAAQAVGPQDFSAIDREISDSAWQINRAGQMASGVNPLTGGVNPSNVNRAEAAWVNQKAAQLLRAAGEDGKAAYRERIGRYFEADAKERNASWPGGVISRWKTGDTPSLRGVTPEEQAWQDHLNTTHETEPNPLTKNLGEDKFKREWKVPKFAGEKEMLEIGMKEARDKNGRRIKVGTLDFKPFARYNMRGSLRATGTTQITQYEYLNKNGQRVKEGTAYHRRNTITTNRTFQTPELNPNGITNGYGLASAVDLLNTGNKWRPIVNQVLRGESVTAEHFDLEKAQADATQYGVPPKPEQLPQERARLTRMLGTSKQAEIRVNEMMQSLEEQSHAFWGR